MKSSKVFKKTIMDDGMTSMFNQMTGVGEINISICYPKYDNIRTYMVSILELLEIFYSSPLLKTFNELKMDKLDIEVFIKKIKVELDSLFDVRFNNDESLMLDSPKSKLFKMRFEQMKKSDIINIIIGVCDKLVRYRKYLFNENEPAKKLSNSFVLTMSGIEWTPLSDFSSINFKYIIDKLETEQQESETNFVLIFLSKLLSLSYKVYKEYSKPDFDLDELSESLVQNIEAVKKHIPRCNKAFNKIKSSVGLLKENFGDYYKDFVQTQNKTIIIENFICDVANNVDKVDPELTRQFNTIIQFYKKHAADQKVGDNPEIKKLFGVVNENLSKMNTYKNVVNVKDLGDEDEEEIAARKKEELEKEEEAKKKQKEEDDNENAEYMKKSVDDIITEFGLN